MTDFIIIGNKNAATTKQMFPLIKDGKVRIGYNKPYFKGLEGLTRWYVTFPVEKEPLTLTATYDPDRYPEYDEYPAIEVGKIANIPKDYEGKMGVPITVLDNPNGFEIVGILKGEFCKVDGNYVIGLRQTIKGKPIYSRVVIRRKEYDN